MNAFHRPSNASFFLVPLLMALGAALPLAAQDEAAPERAAEAAEAYAPRDVSEAIALRMESLGDRAPGPLALRLSLREGRAYLSGLDPEAAARIACQMAYEAELAMRFGSSAARAALSLRRSYAEMGRRGSSEASGKLERATERIRASASGRLSTASWMAPGTRRPTPGPGASR